MKAIKIIQYIIGIVILITFFSSLFTITFKSFYQILILIILIQILISSINKNMINIFFETILLILAIIISIPVIFSSFKSIAVIIGLLLYVFKIIAIPIALIDLQTFKGNTFTYYHNFGTQNPQNKKKETTKKKTTKTIKKTPKFQDAEFSEK